MPPKKLDRGEIGSGGMPPPAQRKTLRGTISGSNARISSSQVPQSPQKANEAPPKEVPRPKPTPAPLPPLEIGKDTFVDGEPAPPGQIELANAAAVIAGRVGTEAYPKGSNHADVLKRLYSQVLAAQDLGHRTCHALWGPKHSGKKTMLTHLSRSLRAIDGLVVVELDAQLHHNDSDALRQIAAEITAFFKSSTSSGVRRKSLQYRDKDPESMVQEKLFGKTLADILAAGGEAPDGATAQDAVAAPATMVNIGGGFTVPFVDIGALNNLQAFLVDLNQRGASMAFLISDFGQFALWCDRVAYIISALMHECDRRVGGVSLVLTTEHFDVGLEKRLASRLTPEMWYLAPMALNAGAVFMMTLRLGFNDRRREHLELHKQIEALTAKFTEKGSKEKETKKSKAAREEEEKRRVTAMKVELVRMEASIQVMAAAYDRVQREMTNPHNILHRYFAVAEQKARLSGLNTSMTKAHLFNALNLLAVRDMGSMVATKCNLSHRAVPFELLCSPEVFIERGYASREAVLLLFYVYIRQQDNVERTLSNILDEIALAFPAVEAKGGAWRYEKALAQLVRWEALAVTSAGKLQLLGPPLLYRTLLLAILRGKLAVDGRSYADIAGIDTNEAHQMSTLLR